MRGSCCGDRVHASASKEIASLPQKTLQAGRACRGLHLQGPFQEPRKTNTYRGCTMAHYCKSCCRTLPNDNFTSAGHRAHICKKCNKLPRETRETARARDDLHGLVRQKNLSGVNIARLKVLAQFDDETIRKQAAVLLRVALVHPHLAKRLPYLQEKQPELYQAYVEAFALEPTCAETPSHSVAPQQGEVETPQPPSSDAIQPPPGDAPQPPSSDSSHP